MGQLDHATNQDPSCHYQTGRSSLQDPSYLARYAGHCCKPKLSLPDRQVIVAKKRQVSLQTALELHQEFSGISIAQIYMYDIHVWNLKRVLKGYNETVHKTT